MGEEEILVIDSQATSKERGISQVLLSNGYNTVAAENVGQAIQLAADTVLDLIVLNGAGSVDDQGKDRRSPNAAKGQDEKPEDQI